MTRSLIKEAFLRHWNRGIVVVGVVAATLAVFLPVLNFDFVNLDDPTNLKRLRDAPVFSQPLLGTIWTEPNVGHYQPLVAMAWWLAMPFAHQDVPINQRLPGPNLQAAHPDVTSLNPKVFHGINLFFHLANVILVFILLQLFEIGLAGAAVGAIFFALHPAQAESVGWVSVLGGLLCSFFMLASVICFMIYGRFSTPDKKGFIPWNKEKLAARYYIASLVAALLAGWSKPLAVIVPGFTLILSMIYFQRGIRKALVETLPFGLISILLLSKALQSQDPGHMAFWVPPADRPWVALDALRFFSTRVLNFFPSGGVDYGRQPNWVLAQPDIFLSLSVFVALLIFGIGVLIYLVRRFQLKGETQRILVLSTGFFLFPLIPVLGLQPFFNQTVSTVADRYLYFPLLGGSLALAFVVNHWVRLKGKGWEWGAALSLTFLISMALIGPTRKQLSIWKNTPTLFEATLLVNPQSWLAYNNLGSYYETRSQSSAAIENYLKSAQIHFRTEPIMRAAILLAEEGKFKEAKDRFEQILKVEPLNAMALYNLGFCWMQLGENQKVRELAQQMLRDRPNMPEALSLLRIANHRNPPPKKRRKLASKARARSAR